MSLIRRHNLVNSGFHPYYTAVLDFARTAGYTLPSTSQQILQNNLVVYLVNKGVWNLLDVLYILATNGDSNYATINWITPASFQLTKVNSPAFATNQGFTGNTTNSYLDTNWIPNTHAVHYTQSLASFGGMINSGSASQAWTEFGCIRTDASAGALFQGRFGGNFGYRINDNFTRQTAVASPVGFWHVDRVAGTGSNSKKVYLNSSSVSTASDNSLLLSDVSFTICALNNGGTKQNFSGRQISMFFAGSSLDTKASDLYTGWNSYFTAL